MSARERHGRVLKVGLIVPAHNESELIDGCARSLLAAAKSISKAGVRTRIFAVCDACSDDTAFRLAAHGLEPIVCDFRNVGAARRLGAEAALAWGAQWLAFTDADTRVAPDWLKAQLALEADAVCGTVAVEDWEGYGERMRAHFATTYFDRDGHGHIHGANLGLSAAAYRSAGGFKPLESSEDVALVEALKASGAKIAWSAAPRVATSARSAYRAPAGFGATLARVAMEHIDAESRRAPG